MAKKNSSWASAFTSLFIESEGSPTSGAPQQEEEVDIDALLAETRSLTSSISPSPQKPAPTPEPAPPAVVASVESSELVIGQPLEELYDLYKVPKSPKKVEEIIAFLHGLRAMPETVQHQALIAMDNADPTWSLADIVFDGRNKVSALNQAKNAVNEQVATKQAHQSQELTGQDEYLASAKATIEEQIQALKQQIDELAALLVTEEEQVQQRREAAQAGMAQLLEEATSEHQRIDTEIERISAIVRVFGPMAQEL